MDGFKHLDLQQCRCRLSMLILDTKRASCRVC
ncbi:hypothetical protein AAZX31_03G051900 [Glycine max]